MQPRIMFFLPLIMSSTKVDSSFLGIYKFFSRSVRSLLSIFLLTYNEVPPLVDSVAVKYSLYPVIDVSYGGFCSFIILVSVSPNISKSRSRIDKYLQIHPYAHLKILMENREFAIPNNFFLKSINLTEG